MGFNIGDKLVYPNHGVGVVETIGESLYDGRAHPCRANSLLRIFRSKLFPLYVTTASASSRSLNISFNIFFLLVISMDEK